MTCEAADALSASAHLLAGRSGWVVGASSGLGRAVAVALGELGARVFVSARRAGMLAETVDLVRAAGAPDAQARPLDMTDRAMLWELLAELAEAPPDMVVVSGGGPPPATAGGLDLHKLDEAYELVLRPAAAIVATLGPAMAARGSGVIGLVTSSGVQEPIPGLATSNVCRAGVGALAKTAATELGPAGVRVLCFAPGRVATDRVAALDAERAAATGLDADEVMAQSVTSIPMGRYGDPDEFGRVVALMCSPVASYVTGVTVLIDGGKSKGLVG